MLYMHGDTPVAAPQEMREPYYVKARLQSSKASALPQPLHDWCDIMAVASVIV